MRTRALCLICQTSRAAAGDTLCKACCSVLKAQTAIVCRFLIDADNKRRASRPPPSRLPVLVAN